MPAVSSDGRAFIAGAGMATRLVGDVVQALQQQSGAAAVPDKEFKRGYRAAMERCDVQLRISGRRIDDLEQRWQSEADRCNEMASEIVALSEQLARAQPISERVRIFLRHYVKLNGWDVVREAERRLINTAAIAALEFYKGLACDGAFLPFLGRHVLEQPTQFTDRERHFIQEALQGLAERQLRTGIGTADETRHFEYPLITARFGQLRSASGLLWRQRDRPIPIGERLAMNRALSLGLKCRLPDHVDELPLWSTSTSRVAGAASVNASGVIWEGDSVLGSLREKMAQSVAKNGDRLRGTVMMPGGVLVPAALEDRAGTYCRDIPFL
jgi:hypothetical protein